MGDGVAGELAYEPCLRRVAAGEGDAYARALQPRGVFQRGGETIEVLRQIVERIENHGNVGLREILRDQPGFVAAENDRLDAVALGE